jgi:predicted 3-demethylubiquinone-9 3-methyltransferase (glyoxalase superfamily)
MADISSGKIRPCLWFNGDAEQAAKHYVSLFDDARIVNTTYWGEGGPGTPGTVLTVEFELAGTPFLGLNGGPEFAFSEAVSFQVSCADQAEVDYFWERLGEGGEPGPCGWLKDRFGLSWQIVPTALPDLLADPDPAKAQAATQAMMGMGKLDIAALQEAVANA